VAQIIRKHSGFNRTRRFITGVVTTRMQSLLIQCIISCPIFSKIWFAFILPFTLNFPNRIVLSDFLITVLYAFLFSSLHAKYLDYISLISSPKYLMKNTNYEVFFMQFSSAVSVFLCHMSKYYLRLFVLKHSQIMLISFSER
jgi:hypothetical protein